MKATILSQTVLQRIPPSRTRDIRKTIERRLQILRKQLDVTNKTKTWVREFTKLYKNERILAAMRIIEGKTAQGVVSPFEKIEGERLVREVLADHPNPRVACPKLFLKEPLNRFTTHHDAIFTSIDINEIRQAAKKTHEAEQISSLPLRKGGLGVVDLCHIAGTEYTNSYAMCTPLIDFNQASDLTITQDAIRKGIGAVRERMYEKELRELHDQTNGKWKHLLRYASERERIPIINNYRSNNDMTDSLLHWDVGSKFLT
ncbi:hypothetical protein GJ496_009085 [Pomphorhynchus laevis]|nr:hypothetical protein GJ496_009085 [Pomphorhynchus laevis]